MNQSGDQSAGDWAQIRMLGEQIADATIIRFSAAHPELRKAEIPAPLKWAGGIIAALFTAGIATLAFWLVTTVSSMQVTLARMDERQSLQTNAQDTRYNELDRRVSKLEGANPGGQE